MNVKEVVWLWVAAYGATLVAFVARMSYVLFGVASEPPDDPKEYTKWKRKRLWLLTSEFCALPLFATTAALATIKGWVDPILAVFYALVCALLGFGFFLKTTRKIVSERFGIEPDDSQDRLPK